MATTMRQQGRGVASSSSQGRGGLLSTDLDSVFNVAQGKLEGVLRSIAARLDENTSRLDALQRSRPVTQASFEAYEGRMRDALARMDDRFARVEARLDTLEQVGGPATVKNAQDIRSLFEISSLQADKEELARFKDEMDAYVVASLETFDSAKANSAVVSAMEESQHAITKEVVALQNMLACKIDRVEVPLLAAASEKIQSLCDFRTDMTQRADNFSVVLADHQEQLDAKQEATDAADESERLAAAIDAKADGDIFDAVRERVAALGADSELIARLRDTTQRVQERVTDVEGRLQATSALAAQLHDAYTTTQEDTDASFASISEWTREMEQRTTLNWDSTSAYFSDVRAQMSAQKEQLNGFHDRLQVCLRFVDWFAAVKLKNTHCHHVEELQG